MNRSVALCLLIVIVTLVVVSGAGDVHRCVHSSTKLAKRGRGNTDTSCMGCDPAQPSCSLGCQKLINKLYENCDEVCLPYGYYFDPRKIIVVIPFVSLSISPLSDLFCACYSEWDLEGCWKDNLKKIKIKVERCGCNSAFSVLKSTSSLFLIFITTLVVFLCNSMYM